MEIIGRITADATVHTTKNNKQVVNFSVAVNDNYRNAAGERVKLTEYYRCAYWITPNIAPYLTKGALVQLTGWASANAWTDSEGTAKANLNFHTSAIQFHGGIGQPSPEHAQANKGNEHSSAAANEPTEQDDLPF